MHSFKASLCFIIGSVLARVQSWSNSDCDPQCTVAERFTADNYDCHSYYFCADVGTPSGPYRCTGEDDIFNPSAIPDPNNLVEPCMAYNASLCNPICSPPECHVSCKQALDTIVDTDSCDTFYLCIPNNEGGYDLHKDICPAATPYFDGNKCVDDAKDCCNVCLVDCEGIEFGTLIPDPFECHNYYMCVGDGEDPVPLTCPEGGSFDLDLGECVSETECQPICSENTTASIDIQSLKSVIYTFF